jgi:hypothetical protein
MTRLTCPSCRLRFTTTATATLATCPECARPLEAVSTAATLGHRLFGPADPPAALPMAAEAVLPVPSLRPDRS